VVSDDHAFWKRKDAVYAKLLDVALISLQIPHIGIDEQITDIQNAFGAKYPPNLTEQHPLIIIAGYTGQHGKQEYCVKRSITEGQRQSVVSNERQLRELRTALQEHFVGKIHAHCVAIACLRKLIK